MTNQRRARVRVVGALALSFTVACGLIVSGAGVPTPSQAIVSDLPTWADVEAAKQNEAAGAAKVTEIEALLVQVEKEAERTRLESYDADVAFDVAQQDLIAAQDRSTKLTAQAEQSTQEADAAAEQAASLVSQLYRSGGVDRNMELFLESDASAADQLLERLAQVEKATERNTVIADTASRARDNASTLGKQAQSAEAERDRLRDEASQRKEEASRLKEEANARLIEQEQQKVQLQAQLDALKDKTTNTTKGYEERVELERQEQIRLEEEARKAAEEAAKNPGNGGGGGGGGGNAGGGGGGGQVSGNWRVPLNSYYVSDWWGASRGHTGVDLAAGGGTPIYAASSGTVTMAGWYNPCYANMVEITHGGGVATRYAHMRYTPAVSYGQWVNTGQIIGYVGTTGCSTGNHLHFEVYTWGYPIDPAPFFAARGLWF